MSEPVEMITQAHQDALKLVDRIIAGEKQSREAFIDATFALIEMDQRNLAPELGFESSQQLMQQSGVTGQQISRLRKAQRIVEQTELDFDGMVKLTANEDALRALMELPPEERNKDKWRKLLESPAEMREKVNAYIEKHGPEQHVEAMRTIKFRVPVSVANAFDEAYVAAKTLNDIDGFEVSPVERIVEGFWEAPYGDGGTNRERVNAALGKKSKSTSFDTEAIEKQPEVPKRKPKAKAAKKSSKKSKKSKGK